MSTGTASKAHKQKKGKKTDTRPARKRYWFSGKLAERKVCNLVRSGYTPREALELWEKTRKRNKGEVQANLMRIAKAAEMVYRAMDAKEVVAG